jgi:hypothetical protein
MTDGNGNVVIATYRPKAGKDAELETLVRGHVARLRSWGFATERQPVILRSKDGTLVEIFEWVSQEAVQQAHHHPEVHKMWAEFEELCTCESLRSVEETSEMFPHFETLD